MAVGCAFQRTRRRRCCVNTIRDWVKLWPCTTRWPQSPAPILTIWKLRCGTFWSMVPWSALLSMAWVRFSKTHVDLLARLPFLR